MCFPGLARRGGGCGALRWRELLFCGRAGGWSWLKGLRLPVGRVVGKAGGWPRRGENGAGDVSMVSRKGRDMRVTHILAGFSRGQDVCGRCVGARKGMRR